MNRIHSMIVVCTDFWDGERASLQIQLKRSGDADPEVTEIRVETPIPGTGGDLSSWGSQVLRAALELL